MLYVRTPAHQIQAIKLNDSTPPAQAALPISSQLAALHLKYAGAASPEQSAARATLDGIPADLVLETICSYLDAPSLLHLAVCNKRLKRIALHNEAWRSAITALGWSDHGYAAVEVNLEYKRVSQYCVTRHTYQQQLPALWERIVDQMDIVNRLALRPALKRAKLTRVQSGNQQVADTVATSQLPPDEPRQQQQQQQYSPRTSHSLVKQCELFATNNYQLPLPYYLFLVHCCNGQSADFLVSGRGFLHGCRLLSIEEMIEMLQYATGWRTADQLQRNADSDASSSTRSVHWLWPISDESGLTRYVIAQDGVVYRANGSHLHDLHYQARDFFHFLRQICNPHLK